MTLNKNGIQVLPPTIKYIKEHKRKEEREKQFLQDWKIRQRIKKKLRILKLCTYCGTRNDLTVDHRIPLILGGPDDKANMIYACYSCNIKKGGRLLDSDVPLFRVFLKRGMIIEHKVPQWLWIKLKEE